MCQIQKNDWQRNTCELLVARMEVPGGRIRWICAPSCANLHENVLHREYRLAGGCEGRGTFCQAVSELRAALDAVGPVGL